MSSPSNSRRVARLVPLTVLMATVAGFVAWAAGGPLDGAVVVSEGAIREPYKSDDTVVIFDIAEVDRFVVEAAARAATTAGATSTTARTGALGMRAITRNGVTVHAPPPGYLIPMVYLALPTAPMGYVVGSDIPAVIGPGKAVMNAVTAELTGAQVGDVVVMQAANGSPVDIQITGIRPYEQIGWAELVFTTDVAAQLGATEDTRVVIFGAEDHALMEQALAAEGLIGRKDTRVSRSWDLPDPDNTLSTAETKLALGEPWYRFNADGSISMHPDWIAANLPPGRELLDPVVQIRARCNVGVVDDLKAALREVATAGLAGAIEVANANTFGGCYGGARYARTSGQIGSISRHSYGMALDTNTTSNCQGCVPKMNCDVVRIFRKHGFAWGGNFRRPDGMHFEWVGEPRDQLSYPSNYCPNVVNPLTQSVAISSTGPSVLVVGTPGVEHDHEETP
jgi:hypothetical protein